MQNLDSSAPVVALRNALHDITYNDPLAEHADRIAALRQHMPHAIEVLPPWIDSIYNCVMHAFELTPADFPNPPFAAYYAKPALIRLLLEKGDLVERGEPAPGRLIVYFHEGAPKHIGRLAENTRVRSQWGTGNLYQHVMAEVPIDYGSQVSFFEPPNRETLLTRVEEWTTSF